MLRMWVMVGLDILNSEHLHHLIAYLSIPPVFPLLRVGVMTGPALRIESL
ncbi:hypothetical protein PS862_03907 [Pseudomonas fluorescens]|uniref:Uncharacterized protein n=1 Tax=Pseudomonas fluorescens TaxID=294 RepID=A0A5E6QVR4_PSEFL|nr:hypothetical protein PS639_01252 [Pseudomonas fluorescens]VVP22040.1 hypothetical protein PS862_03907 [Pseudomonas fluorescens]